MSFFGFGSSSTPAQSDPSRSSELFQSTTFSTSSSRPGPSSSFPSTHATQQPLQAPTAFDTFSNAFDPAKLHPMAALGDKLDFLQLDEDKLTDIQGAASVLPSRGWTDDLCVGTGTTYLSGLAVGGIWGLQEGMARSLGKNASFKLRLNSLLNGSTRRGTLLGNSLGVLAIFYNLTNSGMDHFRGKHDALNSMTAGAASGLVFKCTAGFRPALISAGLMTAVTGGWSYFKTLV